MAITSDTMEIVKARLARLDTMLDEQALTLTGAWVEAWDELAVEFDAALAELIANARDGRVTGSQVAKNMRLRKALDTAARRMEQLADLAGVVIESDVAKVALDAADSQITAAKSQLPPEHLVATLPTFTRVSDDALDAIVQRSTERIHAYTQPIPAEQVHVMKRQLIRGIAVGENPRRTAARILDRTESTFNGGLTRALTISRTETLDAHRAATMAADVANEDITTSWTWAATLSARTCPSCLSMNGSVHPITEPGPIDHQNGRCDRIPKTKTWAELGFDIDEPADALPDARAWFDGLTPGTQALIMGPERLALLQGGQIGWGDLSTRVSTPGWRDSRTATPVRALRAQAA